VTALRDPALRFFAELVVAEGGLFEERDGLVSCLVPDTLVRSLDVPEEVTVTADPDASREDGALLLAPGHPVIDAAARRVLDAADIGVRHLPVVPGPPPTVADLLPLVRDQVGVDHGRVDAAAGAPAGVRLPVLRAGAMVVFDVTPDDRFHETAEIWIDATTGQVLSPGLWGATGRDHQDAPETGGLLRVLAHDLAAAVTAAQAHLEDRSAERLAELVRQRGARAARDEEVARTEAYYRAALDSIATRRSSAPQERCLLLDAQAEAVRAEQARRLREIDDKFEGRFELRPFRLLVVTLPVVEIPLVVRRGPRSWPLTVNWLVGPARVLPVSCPRCGQAAPLVAGKGHLGCRTCLPTASLAPTAPAPLAAPAKASVKSPAPAKPQLPAPAMAPVTAPPPVGPKPPAAAPARRPKAASPARHHAAREQPAADPAGAGDRLARELWRTVLSGRRWPRRDIATGSPLEALVRAYGQRALLIAHDIPAGLALEATKVVTFPTRPGRAEVTTGTLTVVGVRVPFTLRWRREGTRAVPGELLPYVTHTTALATARILPPHKGVSPGPAPGNLDPVGQAVWELAGSDGLPVLARCLAAWWWAQARVDDDALTSMAPEESATLVVEAVRHWPAGNPMVKILGRPDWWAAASAGSRTTRSA
jgi:hypothetical protein